MGYLVLGNCLRPVPPRRTVPSECSVSGRLPPPSLAGRGLPTRKLARCIVRASDGKQGAAGKEGDELLELERTLSEAIQREDFVAAARLRDKINNAKEDSEILLKYANSKFYKAFENRSYPEMQKIWGTGDHVSCLHPGADCLNGRELVMNSWSAIFDGPGKIKVKIEDVRAYCVGNMGFVTCIELVDAGESVGRLSATNVFERQDGSNFRIIHHHACPLN